MSNCHPKCHRVKNRVVSGDNSAQTRDCSSDLLANYPAFATALEAFPEATEAVISADLPADLAAERDVLLLATAQLWQAWRDLGAAIALADRPTLIQ